MRTTTCRALGAAILLFLPAVERVAAGEEHAPLVAIPQDGRSDRVQVRYRF